MAALSRVDDETEICDQCGQDEAMADYYLNQIKSIEKIDRPETDNINQWVINLETASIIVSELKKSHEVIATAKEGKDVYLVKAAIAKMLHHHIITDHGKTSGERV